MKKVISLILALVLCSTLCACGDGNVKMTKEEMLRQALVVDESTISNDSFHNFAKAKSTYCNTILLLDGTASEIKEDHVVVGSGGYWAVDVYLPIDDLMKLQKGQRILVLGQTNDVITEEEWSILGITQTLSHYCMPAAYLVRDRFEIQGTLNSIDASSGIWHFYVEDSVLGEVVHFADGVDLSKYSESYSSTGYEVTISAKIVNGSYYDAYIVE